MNISENETFMYLDYDYNDTCDQDPGPELPDGSLVLPVLYYVLFCLSLLGMFKHLHLIKQRKHVSLSSHILIHICILGV